MRYCYNFTNARTATTTVLQTTDSSTGNSLLLKMFRVGGSLAVVILLVEQCIASSFREYEQFAGARCTQTDRFLNSLSAAGKLRCAVVCLATTNCNSFNYYHHDDNDNSTPTSLNCELVTTTWADTVNDDDALTADDADWSFYGSHPLLTSGTYSNNWAGNHVSCKL